MSGYSFVMMYFSSASPAASRSSADALRQRMCARNAASVVLRKSCNLRESRAGSGVPVWKAAMKCLMAETRSLAAGFLIFSKKDANVISAFVVAVELVFDVVVDEVVDVVVAVSIAASAVLL